MLVCLKKDMRVLKLAASPPVCTLSAHRSPHIHTLKQRDPGSAFLRVMRYFFVGSEKSHVDHFTQSWTLDSNQSLSLSCNNALSDHSDKNDFTQWSKLLKVVKTD